MCSQVPPLAFTLAAIACSVVFHRGAAILQAIAADVKIRPGIVPDHSCQCSCLVALHPTYSVYMCACAVVSAVAFLVA